ncbi:MAG TPA: Lpg1974 family pore-forming outer membrane protein, partial [Candidatus Babeliaceae bacterium]|nr:Lpg1974 family pore-forming outer membrane protein [Candidatus Babeliaceae bacterium]
HHTNWQTETNVANSGGDAFLPATKAEGEAHLHINLVDGELGREFFVSRWLTLRPFVGARGAWINRNYEFEYKVNNGDEIEGHKHNRFRGAGLRTGLDTQWGLGSGWSFFGDLALSLIYGKTRLHSHQDREVAGGETRIEHLHNSWTIARPMMDFALGLRWDRLVCDDAYRIRLQLAWEQLTLLGFVKDMNFVSGAQGKYAYKNGDLSLNGLAFQFRFDF